MKNRIIIPARLKSTRFPNKLIKLINGTSLIEHICTRAKKIKHDSLIVATDDQKIKSIVDKLNIDVWFSKKKYINGTHRIAALSKDLKFNSNDNVINIQGDEYNFSLKGVKDIIANLSLSKNKYVYTLISRSFSKNSVYNSDVVKVVVNQNNQALYFSRTPIIYRKNNEHIIHIGIYGYKASLLRDYLLFKRSPYEISESLEQLRFIWNEVPIYCINVSKNNSVSINSPNDLKLAKGVLK